MKRLLAMILSAVMVVSLAACSSQPAATEAPAATTAAAAAETKAAETAAAPAAEASADRYLKVSLPLNETLTGLKPVTTEGYSFVIQLIFGQLLRYDMEKGIVPALAASWTVSDDGLVYTFTLGDNYFHDGDPITAKDVVWSFNNVICGAGGRRAKLSSIKGYQDGVDEKVTEVEGIKAIDDKTVEFTLSQRDSLFLDAMTWGAFSIMPSKYFEGKTGQEVKDDAEFWAKPIGSGAYYVADTAYPNYIVLKKFDKYYDPAGIDQVLCTKYVDMEALYAAMIAGDIDYLPREEYEAAENIVSQNPDCQLEVVDSNYRRWFMVNCSSTAGDGATHPSLKNARVRQALDMILDKEAICALMGPLTTPLTSQINPNLSTYNTSLPAWKRDVEGAKKILDEEGFDYNTPLRIVSNYTDQLTADFLELVTQNYAEAGVKVETKQDSNWQPMYEVQDYDFRYAGGMDNNVINYYTSYIVEQQGVYTKGNWDVTDELIAYTNERYRDPINAYKATLDPVEQQEILNDLQYKELEDMYFIPLYAMNNTNVYNTAHVTGIPKYPGDYEEQVDFHFSEWRFVD